MADTIRSQAWQALQKWEPGEPWAGIGSFHSTRLIPERGIPPSQSVRWAGGTPSFDEATGTGTIGPDKRIAYPGGTPSFDEAKGEVLPRKLRYKIPGVI